MKPKNRDYRNEDSSRAHLVLRGRQKLHEGVSNGFEYTSSARECRQKPNYDRRFNILDPVSYRRTISLNLSLTYRALDVLVQTAQVLLKILRTSLRLVSVINVV